MSVRVLVDAVGKLAEQPLFGDPSTCICDAFDYHGPGPCSACLEGAVVQALAAIREQAGVGEVARAIFAGRYGPGNEALWKIERWSYERDARAALRALGLEDA